jgi:hypothetical protein
MRMQAIINELGDAIPEVTDAWNAETGELKLTNEQLDKMVENYKNVAIQQAAMNAMQEVTNALVEAQISLEEGEASKSRLEERAKALEELKQLYLEMDNAYAQGMESYRENGTAADDEAERIAKLTELRDKDII